MIKRIETEKLDGTYTQVGKEVVTKGKYGVCILAGGQGSRLKVDGPKGCVMLDLGDRKEAIFEIHFQKMKGTKVPVFIIVSRENEADTREYFKRKKYFEEYGYNKELIKIVEQEELPLLRLNREILRINGEVKYGSSGHGAVYKALAKTEVREEIDSLGIQLMYITNVDNILQKPLDFDFIGLAYKKNLEVAVKSVKKSNSNERVGLFVESGGKLNVLEYNEVSEEISNRRDENGELYLQEANIMTQILSVKFIKEAAKVTLPVHEQYKEKWGEKFIKRETLMFDAFPLADNFSVIQVLREDEFAPIKNFKGEDSLDSATLMYLRWLRKEEVKESKVETLEHEYNI